MNLIYFFLMLTGCGNDYAIVAPGETETIIVTEIVTETVIETVTVTEEVEVPVYIEIEIDFIEMGIPKPKINTVTYPRIRLLV